MRIESFQKLKSEYNSENRELEVKDLIERKKLQEKYKYSIIIEGDFMEFDNLEKWIKQNINDNGLENIYYGKTGYNYGFLEYFVNEKLHEEKLNSIVPRIFTIYPNANPSRKICKSNGYNIRIEYDVSDNNAIVFKNE